MSLTELYLLNVVIELSSSISTIGTMSLIYAVLAVVGYLPVRDIGDISFSDYCRKARIKAAIVLFGAMLIVNVFVPSKESLMIIVGGYYLTNIDNIDALPANAVNAANKFLEMYADDEKEEESK